MIFKFSPGEIVKPGEHRDWNIMQIKLVRAHSAPSEKPTRSRSLL